ncbi:MAG: hypothetical protein ABIR32_08065 [Ilumatobacteraceae bacterium]
MIRRPRLLSTAAVLTAVALSASLTAGCSTFTDNSLAAKAGSHELSIDDLAAINADLPKLSGDASMIPDALGEYNGSVVRQALTLWANSTGLIAGLENSGIQVSGEDRQAASTTLQGQDATTWATLSRPTQDLLIDFTASQTALKSSGDANDPAAAKAIYEQGVGTSGVICIRIMAFDTEAEATDAYSAVQAGEKFADLANDHPVDPAAEPNNGVYADPKSGSECFEASGYTSVAQAVADLAIGESSPPVTLGSQFFFLIQQRPYDEVADAVQPLLAATLGQARAGKFLSAADISIDSRYGMWDAATSTVVPTR